MKKLRGVCIAAVFSAVCSQPCWGGAIISLELQTGGTYDYELLVTTQAIAVQPDQDIVLSGLSGVTNAAVSLSLASGASAGPTCTGLTLSTVTSTSVTLVNDGGQCFYLGTYGTLEVDSSMTTAGVVDFSIQTPGGFITGTTSGPVSSVPEPAAWAMSLAGVAALGVRHCLRRAA